MATRKRNYNATGIADLPNDKSVLYRIKTRGGNDNYVGVAARGKVIEQISGHLGEVPGATVHIEQFDKIADARKKAANLVERNSPKYNG